MADSKQNPLAARAVVAAATTLGVVAGFMFGCSLAIPLAEIHLKKYLGRVAVQNDASMNEARGLLAQLQHSAKPPCSDAELGFFRDLIFQSDYLKDAGRIHGGKIECSAAQGRLLQPASEFEPGPAQTDATAGNRKLVPIYDPSLKRSGIEEGSVFVVFGSLLPIVEESLPVHLAVDPADASSPGMSKQPSSGAFGDKVSEYVIREGDTLVAKRCSALLSNCVTASLGVGEAQKAEIVVIGSTSVLGGIICAFAALSLLFLRRRSISMDQQLRRALAGDQLNVVYQPIVDLANRRIVGAEALTRWTTEEGTAVAPDVFIKVAEQHGFIGLITKFVLRRSLKEFREVFEKIPNFRLNINVAAADLVDPKFLPTLDQIVAEAEVRPNKVVLEVTESSTASREAAMESIRELRRRGHGIYIDDFGTGYSSLSYLLYLSVDTIKIDKAFVRAIGTDAVTVAILPQIIAMARSLNLGVVVEGIESEGQADYFSTDNIRIYGQGYLYGRPVAAQEFLKLVGLAPNAPEILGNPEAAELPALGPALAPGYSPR